MLFALASVARADDAPSSAAEPRARFGDGGFAISTGTSLELSTTNYTNSPADNRHLLLALGLDFFTGQRFSLGLALQFEYRDHADFDDADLVRREYAILSAGIRGGYVIHLGPRFSFYPRASFGIHYIHQHTSRLDAAPELTGRPDEAASERVGPWIQGDLLLLLHVSPDFFVGVGPSMFHDFVRATGVVGYEGNLNQLSLSLQLGGVVGGEVTAPPSEDDGERLGFGHAGEVVLSSDLNVSGSLGGVRGDDSNTQMLTIAPGCDWFFADNISVGGTLSLALSHSTTQDTRVVDHKSTVFGANPRLGYNLPFNQWLSLYAQAGLWFQLGSLSARTDLADNSPSFTSMSLSFAARLIAAISPHFFVGLGPSLFHDLSYVYRYDDGTRIEDHRTLVGLSSIIGGWF